MFKFEHTEYFYAFAALPLMLLLFVWYFMARRKKLKRIGDEALVKALLPYASRRKRVIKLVLFLLGFDVANRFAQSKLFPIVGE